MGFCYQKNFSNPTMPVDEAQFYALVRGTEWGEKIDKFRETGDQAIKRKLPAFIFQATFDDTTSKAGKTGAWRKQVATKLTGLVVMDIDHVDNPLTLYQGWIEKGLDLKALGIVLIYITPSGKGIKIVFKARLDWGNLIDNQHAMGNVLNVVVDESCKDASRMSFVCKESDILYIDKELFTYENKEFAERYNALYRDGLAERYNALYRDGHSQATQPLSSRPNTTSSLSSRPNVVSGEISQMRLGAQAASRKDVSTTLDMTEGGKLDMTEGGSTLDMTKGGSTLGMTEEGEKKTFKGIAYEDIIEEWWKINGGVPQEGERNVKLYQLAVSLINWQLAYVLFAIIISSWFIAYYLAWVLIIWRLSAL